MPFPEGPCKCLTRILINRLLRVLFLVVMATSGVWFYASKTDVTGSFTAVEVYCNIMSLGIYLTVLGVEIMNTSKHGCSVNAEFGRERNWWNKLTFWNFHFTFWCIMTGNIVGLMVWGGLKHQR